MTNYFQTRVLRGDSWFKKSSFISPLASEYANAAQVFTTLALNVLMGYYLSFFILFSPSWARSVLLPPSPPTRHRRPERITRAHRLRLFRFARRLRKSKTPSRFTLPSSVLRARRLITRALRRTGGHAQVSQEVTNFLAASAPNRIGRISAIRRQAEADSHNRLMHALNGNIAPDSAQLEQGFSPERTRQIAVAEFSTAAVPEFNGAVQVLTEFLFSASGDEGKSFPYVGADTFSGAQSMLQSRIDLFKGVSPTTTDATDVGTLTRDNLYMLNYPTGSGRLEERRADPTRHRILGSTTSVRTINVTRAVEVRQTEVTGPKYLLNEKIAAFWNDSYSPEDLRAAHNILQDKRFTAARGNRQVLGWDAQGDNRSNRLHALALRDAQGSSYYRMFFRLWCAYFSASIRDASQQDAWIPQLLSPQLSQANAVSLTDPTLDPNGTRVPQRVTVTPLSANIPAAQQNQAVNPEAPLQEQASGADGNIADLGNGAAHFIDAENLTSSEIRWLIWALAPADSRYQWSHNGAGALANSRFISQYERFNEMNQANSAGAFKFFVHYGNRDLPTQDATNMDLLGRAPAGGNVPNDPANSPWSQVPDRVALESLISHMIRKHHAANDAFLALDLAIHHFSMWDNNKVCGGKGNLTPNAVNAFGTRALQLPRDFTAPAYFDFARYPMSMDVHAPDVKSFTSLTPRHQLWTCFNACHATASSLNWPAFAFSMRGREWDIHHGVGNAPNQFERSLVDGMTATLFNDEISQWQAYHQAAQYHMYGFSPSIVTTFSVGTSLINLWGTHMSPYLANPYHEMWMLQKIPEHMVLPIEGSVPYWPGEPEPLDTMTGVVRPFVRVARSTPLFTQRAYVQNGGMMANLTKLAAVPLSFGGVNAPVWRSDRGAEEVEREDFDIETWVSPFQTERPADPASFPPTWMAPAGNVFGSFLLPGSVQNYSTARNRIHANGIRSKTHAAAYLAQSWERMVHRKEQANVALKYIPPAGFRVELPPVNDYSLLVWNHPSGLYSGQTLVNNSPGAVALPPPVVSTGLGRSAFPAHLANHNSPHAPNGNAPLPGSKLNNRGGRALTAPGYHMQRLALGHSSGGEGPGGGETSTFTPVVASAAPGKRLVDAPPPLTGPPSGIRTRRQPAPLPDYSPKNPVDISGAKDRILAKGGKAPSGSPDPPAPNAGGSSGRPLDRKSSPQQTRSRITRRALSEPPSITELPVLLQQREALQKQTGVLSFKDPRIDVRSETGKNFFYVERRIEQLLKTLPITDLYDVMGDDIPSQRRAELFPESTTVNVETQVVVNPEHQDMSPLVEDANDAAALEAQRDFSQTAADSRDLFDNIQPSQLPSPGADSGMAAAAAGGVPPVKNVRFDPHVMALKA